jgi:adenosylhomocysteine nucleosidase
MPPVAVTGLAAEAAIIRRAGWHAVAAGGDAGRTDTAIAGVLAQGASALLSFGIAGGLDPGLVSGSIVLPLAVRDAAGARMPVDRGWHGAVAGALAALGIAVTTGDVLGADSIVASPERKRLLFDRGAVIADLESHRVARAAAAAGVPFLVLRAVADPARRTVPPAARVGLDGEGHAALGAVLGSLLRQPAQLPALLRIAGDTRAALRALGRAVPALRPLAK